MINISIQSTQELPQTSCTTATDNSVINQTTHAIFHLTTNETPLESTPAVFTLPTSFETTLKDSTVKSTFQSTRHTSTMSQLAYGIPVFATCTPKMSTTPYTLQPEHSTFIPNSCKPMTSMSTNGYNTAIPFNTTGNLFNPADNNQFQSTPYTNIPQYQEQSQIDAFTTIAQIIKQEPSLPKIELMKFSGDPLEYAEFVTNFKDNIESQVIEDSQRLTRLLA